MYTSSRALCSCDLIFLGLVSSRRFVDGLAIAQNAPGIFKRTAGNGLPWVALSCSAAFAFLAFMGVSAGSGKVFTWFANMTAVAGLMTWFGIAVTYIRFYAGVKAQGLDRSKFPYYSKLQPYAAWYAASSCLFICFVRFFGCLCSYL